MRKNHSGDIINFSSALGLVTLPTMGFYGATKFAVEGYSETLAQEVDDLGIKVMIVEPSGFRTDWSGRSSKKVVPTETDYAKFTDMITSNNQNVTQAPGDPDAAAQIIFDQVAKGKSIPLHLPIGQFANDGARDKFKDLNQKFADLAGLSYSADR